MRTHDLADDSRLAVLDGWRGISILAVLACHLLPLGPKSWALNDTAGPVGMALFFTLSGFLICRFLLHRPDVPDFLIRRGFRILPLAWLSMLIFLWWEGPPAATWVANLAFYANLPPQHLTQAGSHLWSLGVEVHFYAAIALLVSVAGRRGLMLLPLAALAITVHRVAAGAEVDIVTWRRGDEILAGATLALVYEGRFGLRARQFLRHANPWLLVPLLALSSHPAADGMNYLRPYVAALLVGGTLVSPSNALIRMLSSRSLGYIATVSYALYVIHHGLMYTWLGSGDRLEKYLKRPLLFAATFALAHISTFHFERHFIRWGKQLSRLRAARQQDVVAHTTGAER